MKSFIRCFILGCLFMGVSHIASAATKKTDCTPLMKTKKPVAMLDNVDTKPDSGVTVPKKDTLADLDQLEGIDPFGYFEEGMDPENENGLCISNDADGLRVGVGGCGFQTGPDGDNQITVTPLRFNTDEQRYLVAIASDGSDGIHLIINIDRHAKRAKVWMQEKEKRWSKWLLAGVYGFADDQPESTDTEITSPDAIAAPVVAKYQGVVGEDQNDRKRLISFRSDGKSGYDVRVFNGGHELTGATMSFHVNREVGDHIATGELAKLDKASVTDAKAGVTVDFKIDGTDFQGNVRLRMVITTSKGITRISSCSPWKPAQAYQN